MAVDLHVLQQELSTMEHELRESEAQNAALVAIVHALQASEHDMVALWLRERRMRQQIQEKSARNTGRDYVPNGAPRNASPIAGIQSAFHQSRRAMGGDDAVKPCFSVLKPRQSANMPSSLSPANMSTPHRSSQHIMTSQSGEGQQIRV